MQFSLNGFLQFQDLFSMIAYLVIWVLGLSAVTQPGKILHPFRVFFDRKVPKRFAAYPEGNNKYDIELLNFIKSQVGQTSLTDIDLIGTLVAEYLRVAKLEVEVDAKTLYLNAIEHTTTLVPTQNQYYYWRDTERLPWQITDPIITCPTCMPSLHGLILYTIFSYYMNWDWNPLVWVLIAVPSTIFTDQIWKLRKK